MLIPIFTMGIYYTVAVTDCAEAGQRVAPPYPRSGAVAERNKATSKERWLHGCRKAERSYSRFRVRRGDLVQGKEGAAAALCWNSREEIPHVQGKRNPRKMVGAVRGHQRPDTLKS